VHLHFASLTSGSSRWLQMRKLSVDLLLSTSRLKPQYQYIFLTPHDVLCVSRVPALWCDELCR
jgi:hypothetical protein